MNPDKIKDLAFRHWEKALLGVSVLIFLSLVVPRLMSKTEDIPDFDKLRHEISSRIENQPRVANPSVPDYVALLKSAAKPENLLSVDEMKLRDNWDFTVPDKKYSIEVAFPIYGITDLKVTGDLARVELQWNVSGEQVKALQEILAGTSGRARGSGLGAGGFATMAGTIRWEDYLAGFRILRQSSDPEAEWVRLGDDDLIPLADVRQGRLASAVPGIPDSYGSPGGTMGMTPDMMMNMPGGGSLFGMPGAAQPGPTMTARRGGYLYKYYDEGLRAHDSFRYRVVAAFNNPMAPIEVEYGRDEKSDISPFVKVKSDIHIVPTGLVEGQAIIAVVKYVPREEGKGKGFWAKREFFVSPGEPVGRTGAYRTGKGSVGGRGSAPVATRTGGDVGVASIFGMGMGPSAFSGVTGAMGPTGAAGPMPGPARPREPAARTATSRRVREDAIEVDYSTGLTLLGFRQEFHEADPDSHLYRMDGWLFIFADASGNVDEKWQENLVDVLKRNSIRIGSIGVVRQPAARTGRSAQPGFSPGVGAFPPGVGGMPPGANW